MKFWCVHHYLVVGGKNGLNPNEFFSTDYYLSQNPDVLGSGVNPLVHFIVQGASEDRVCHPELNVSEIRSLIKDHGGPSKTNYLSELLSLVGSNKVSKETVLGSVCQRITQIEVQDVSQSGLLDIEYYLAANPDVRLAGVDPIHHYLHFGFKEDRNPSIIFDTSFYRQSYMDQDAHLCPLIHYIRAENKPKALRPPYAVDLSEPELSVSYSKDKIALQIHAFYPDSIKEMVPLIKELDENIDLLISTTSESKKSLISKTLEKSNVNNAAFIRVVENIGRDIAPLFLGFNDAWSRYEYICHLHSKKSPHTSFGHRWRYYLFDQLIGKQSQVDRVINHFEQSSDIGILFPENFYEIKKFVGWNGNKKKVHNFFSELGFSDVELDTFNSEFPAGSMCWMRTKAFEPLTNANLSLDVFEVEGGQEEGTLAHVIERCLTLIPQLTGFKIGKYYGPINDTDKLLRIWNSPDFTKSTIDTASRWLRDTPEIALNERLPLNPQFQFYNESSLNIHWVIPDFGIGAGGHMTIFRMVKFLEEFGHRQTIWIQNAQNYKTPLEAKSVIQGNYQKIGDRVIVQFLPEDVERISGDVIIATDCWTVFPSLAMPKFKERFYLIQDWEPMFHPVGDSHLIAELTYRLGLNALCAGKWLHQKATESGLWARKWDLATDREFYYPAPSKQRVNGVPHIVFYSRAYTPRRAVMLGVAALKRLHSKGVKFHVSFFGQDDINFEVEFSHSYEGILSPKELGDLYREADFGMVFSATNYSLIPLEMMSCGLPILELDTESTRAVFDPSIVEMADGDPLAIADKLEEMIKNPTPTLNKAARALEYSQSLDWRNSAKDLEKGLKEKLREDGFKAVNTDLLFTKQAKAYKHKAAIVIPTFNAGDDFKPILLAIASQKCNFSYEIIIIDSGSTDSTLELIEEISSEKITVKSIPNTEFQHGRTRNLAISFTDAEFVSVITQDALPKDENWLNNLIKGFEKAENIAGVFGRHEAYKSHSCFVKRDIERVFERFDMFGDVYTWAMDAAEPGSLEWQMLLQYYSDNNSCMRRSVWEQLPYPEIDWGEDQAWAWMIIQLGLAKAYAGDSVVFHSHDDSLDVRQKTAKTEGMFFREQFGIDLYAGVEDVEPLIRKEQDADAAYGKMLDIDESTIGQQLGLIRASHMGRFEGAKSPVGLVTE